MSKPFQPIDAHAVFMRIRSLVELQGGPAAAVRDTGLKLSTLNSYLEGKALPGAMSLAQMSRGFGVTADFLLFGEGR